MDFTYSETQTMLADTIARFLSEHHDFAARQKRLHAGLSHDATLWSELADMGLMGIEISEDHGGSGMSFEELAVVLEQFGRALVIEPFVPTIVLGAGLLRELGSADQQQHWLPAIATGSLKVALAHGERQARGMLEWVTSAATRTGNGWRLDGTKMVVMGGDIADLFLISARTSGAADEREGLSLFAVPRETPGLNLRSYTLYDGSGAAEVTMDAAVVGVDALLGVEGLAISGIERAYDRGAVAVCVEAVGAMQHLRDLTLDYIKTRRQFGQPIGTFQVLQHRMVDIHMAVEIARSMAMSAIVAIGDENRDVQAAAISAAKAAIGKAAREVGQAAVQLHGGIALTNEYAAGHYFKKLTMAERAFGDVDHHLDRYAALMSN